MSSRAWSFVAVTVAAVAVILVAVVRQGSSAPPIRVGDLAPPPEAVAPTLRADRIEHDFGDIPIDGGPVSARFTLTNPTSAATRVTDLYTSCMCTTVMVELADGSRAGPFGMPGHDLATQLNRTVEPGERFVAEVTFDPAAHGPEGVGPVMRQVLFQESDGGRLLLTLMANVLPPSGS